MAVYRRGRVWWFKFTWKGEPIRESTKQTNKRVAEQMEAAHKTSLAKGEVGLRDRVPAPTVRRFAADEFLPFCRSTFAAKPNTLSYYENGAARLLEFPAIAEESLDTISNENISAYARHRHATACPRFPPPRLLGRLPPERAAPSLRRQASENP